MSRFSSAGLGGSPVTVTRDCPAIGALVGGSLLISWVSGSPVVTVTFPAFPATGGATIYNVYRNTDGGLYTLVHTQFGTVAWDDTTVVAGHIYGYKIEAQNICGNVSNQVDLGTEDTTFNPASLGNMLLWVYADTNIEVGGIGEGDSVDAWTDHSGLGNDLNSVILQVQPTWLGDPFSDGLGAVNFGNDFGGALNGVLNSGTLAGGGAGYTIITVGDYYEGADRCLYNSFARLTAIKFNGVNTLNTEWGNGAIYQGDVNFTTVNMANETQFFMAHTVVGGGGDNKIYLNNNAVETHSGGNFIALAGFNVGAHRSGVYGTFWNGLFREIIVYPSVLNATQIATLKSYMNTKWTLGL